jgi:UDP-2-acetamido-3-amino-2,3-dideoxy-glucuronate N-acetyltransferase
VIKIHPHALVETDEIGEGTAIWAFAHVMQGARIGSACNIGDHAFIESGAIIGSRVTIKNQVLIWEGLTIEDDVFIGPRVSFTNDRFPRSPRMAEVRSRYQSKENWLSPTRVRQGCSIGAGAIICPGLELGRYCVIGAGAVVTKSVPAYTLVVGNPARPIGDVCSCGQRLAAAWNESRCDQCGETGCARSARLAGQKDSLATIEGANTAK